MQGNISKEKEHNFYREQEIKDLRSRLEKLETGLEKEKSAESEKAVKQEIKKYIQETQSAPNFAGPVSSRDEAKEISEFQPSQQVGALISLVFQKGLKQAVAVARDLDNPAILDEFHDVLVDRYYEELIERGILK